MEVPEAPCREIRRRGVPVLPPGPPPPALPQLRARAAVRLRRVPVVLLLGLRRRGRPRPQPHRAGAPDRALEVRGHGLLRRVRRRGRRPLHGGLGQAEGAGLGVAAVLEARGAVGRRGAGGGRGRGAGAAALQLRVRHGGGGEDRSRGSAGAVGVALPEPTQGVPAPQVVGERGGAGVSERGTLPPEMAAK